MGGKALIYPQVSRLPAARHTNTQGGTYIHQKHHTENLAFVKNIINHNLFNFLRLTNSLT